MRLEPISHNYCSGIYLSKLQCKNEKLSVLLISNPTKTLTATASYCCVTAVLLMLLRSTLQNFYILDSLPGVVVGVTVIATHLFLVDQPGGSHSQPVEQLFHLTVTPERITMKIDLTLIAAGI